MKRLAVLTTSLLFAVTALGGVPAYAAESGTIYPENGDFIKTLTFSDLKDYEITENGYYFLDGETYRKYEKGELYEIQPEEDFSFTPEQTEITTGRYYYYYDEDGALTVHDKTTKITKTYDGEYTLLKQYGGADKVYAVKDNVLYCFDNAQEPAQIKLEYSDYSATQQIAVGQSAENLKNYEKLTFVTVSQGAYMTETDLTTLESQYFVTDKTVICESQTTALLLCYSGNAALIAIGDNGYVLNKANTQETEIDCKTTPEFPNATVTGNRIYASPYVIIGTSMLANAAGTIVNVKGKLELSGVLGSVYYEVEYYDADGRVKTGYVADGFLTEYIIEDNKQPSTVPDPSHSEKTDTRTVLLILAAVVLVLAAVGYLAFIGTSDKRKNKDKKSKKNKKDKSEIQPPEQ